LEWVLRSRHRHHKGLLRYDIADAGVSEFSYAGMELAEFPDPRQGRVVGLMRQVEDVTVVTTGTLSWVSDREEAVTELAVALTAVEATLASLEEEHEQLREALLSSRAIGGSLSAC